MNSDIDIIEEEKFDPFKWFFKKTIWWVVVFTLFCSLAPAIIMYIAADVGVFYAFLIFLGGILAITIVMSLFYGFVKFIFSFSKK